MIEDIYKIIDRNEPFSIFLGAGISIGPLTIGGSRVGLGTGENLANYLIDEFKLSSMEPDLINISDECSFEDDSRFRNTLRNYFGKGIVQRTHELIVDIIDELGSPKDFLLTVNVDDLLEQAYRKKHGCMLPTAKRSSELNETNVYLKLHGCVNMINEAVFTTRDFLQIDRDDVLLSKLKTIFAERSVVFIGFGLRDIDILRLLYQQGHDNLSRRPHFWVNPKTGSITTYRKRHYMREFNITYIENTAEEFFELLLSYISKKKSRDNLVNNLKYSDFKANIRLSYVKSLLENIDYLNEAELKEKLLFQCIIARDKVQSDFHKIVNNALASFSYIDEVLKRNSQVANTISLDGIPIMNQSVLDVLPLLKGLSDKGVPGIAEYLLRHENSINNDLVRLIFTCITESQLGYQSTNLFNNHREACLEGLIQNKHLGVIDNFLAISDNDDVADVLRCRRDQLNGLPYKDEIKEPFIKAKEILFEQDKEVRVKIESVWNNTRSDEMNTSGNRFVVSQELSKKREINITSEVASRVLIGNGFIFVNGNLHFIGQEKEYVLEKTQVATIWGDMVVACSDNMAMIYDSEGNLLKIEVLEYPVSIPPKAFNNILYIVTQDNSLYCTTLESDAELITKIEKDEEIIDFVISNDYISFVTPHSIITGSINNLASKEMDQEIRQLIGDNERLYIINSTSILLYDLNQSQIESHINLVPLPDTQVVLVDEQKLAYGAGNSVVFIDMGLRQPCSSSTIISEGITILDLIVCDNVLIMIGSDGYIYYLDKEGLGKKRLNTSLLRSAEAISAGSGIICVSSRESVWLMENIA